jgi:hypothetical protein
MVRSRLDQSSVARKPLGCRKSPSISSDAGTKDCLHQLSTTAGPDSDLPKIPHAPAGWASRLPQRSWPHYNSRGDTRSSFVQFGTHPSSITSPRSPWIAARSSTSVKSCNFFDCKSCKNLMTPPQCSSENQDAASTSLNTIGHRISAIAAPSMLSKFQLSISNFQFSLIDSLCESPFDQFLLSVFPLSANFLDLLIHPSTHIRSILLSLCLPYPLFQPKPQFQTVNKDLIPAH